MKCAIRPGIMRTIRMMVRFLKMVNTGMLKKLLYAMLRKFQTSIALGASRTRLLDPV